MSDADRLDAIEEALMRLQSEVEQLDDALRTQARNHDELARRVEKLERRLARVEPDADSSDVDGDGDGDEQTNPSQMDTDRHG